MTRDEAAVRILAGMMANSEYMRHAANGHGLNASRAFCVQAYQIADHLAVVARADPRAVAAAVTTEDVLDLFAAEPASVLTDPRVSDPLIPRDELARPEQHDYAEEE